MCFPYRLGGECTDRYSLAAKVWVQSERTTDRRGGDMAGSRLHIRKTAIPVFHTCQTELLHLILIHSGCQPSRCYVDQYPSRAVDAVTCP